MTAKKMLAVFGTTLLLITSAPLGAATLEESFRKNFPDIRADSIRPTSVKGLYEIVSGAQVFYYVPGPEYMIYGAIITQDRRNLTQERVQKILTENLKTAPLEKAVKIGSGPHTVIEFTDPDCSYCRQASAFLSARNDVTRYVFFFPLSIHPNARAKIRHIFCATDRTLAYEQAMTGKLDDMKFTLCEDTAAIESVKTHTEIGVRIGVNGTPLFLIDGQIVEGADIPLMKNILDGKK
jgi:thiol:disulfide interchange protein DsbC